MAVRKTIRFYDDKEDEEALRLLEHHKEYGYSCEREMIVKALLLLNQQKDNNTTLDANEIAKKVVEQLRQFGLMVQTESIGEVEKKQYGETNAVEAKESESLDDALDFINQL